MEERQVRIKSTSRGKPAYVNHLRSFAKRKPHSDKHIANRISCVILKIVDKFNINIARTCIYIPNYAFSLIRFVLGLIFNAIRIR